jgi:hypothetical protein
MKERPILMSGPMVRGILDGRKLQTRRLIKPQPQQEGGRLYWIGERFTYDITPGTDIDRSPYGVPGDRLWVKETFFPVHKWKHAPLFAAVKGEIICRADYDYRESRGSVIGCHKWTPSIFMPRRLSRILLEVTAVRVERLNSITEQDALAEGCAIDAGHVFKVAGAEHFGHRTAVGCYQTLWTIINGPGSWAINPWVWVIEFTRVV